MTQRPPKSLAVLLNQAVAAHRAGNLAGADALYDKVLKADRGNADALNLKAVIASARGDHAGALGLLERAVKAAPAMADVHANRGNALAAMGRGDEALTAYREAIRLRPAHLEAWLNAGALFHRAGRIAEAVGIFRAAAKACPEARVFYNLGQCLRELPAPDESARKAVLEEAAGAFKDALSLNPAFTPAQVARSATLAELGDCGEAITSLEAALARETDGGRKREHLNNLGELYRKDGRLDRAIALLREALALDPRDATVRFNLALSLATAKENAEAEAIYRALIADTPDLLKAYVNFGNLLRDQKRDREAIAVFEQALDRDPALAEAYTNIGACLADRGWLFAAALEHHKALSLKSADAETRLNFAVILLRQGRFAEGWPPYENRFGAFEQHDARPAPPAYWQGEDLRDKSVLVWTEQGLGDEILYASMIPDLIARAGRCRIECSKRLVPVFARSFPGIPVTGWENPDTPTQPNSDVDVQVAAGSLGQYLRPSFDSFPKRRAYLTADPARVAQLRADYEARAKGKKIVGIAWRSGNARLGADKSATLADFAAVLTTPGCIFVNLQYGDCRAEIADLRARLNVEVFQDPAVDHIADIDAAFAQAAAMDVVISTSNTAVHLAAAQGIPTWVVLPHAKGVLWYWFARREDSPWYPAARLFRAPADVDPWAAGAAPQVAGALRALVSARSLRSETP